jgi:hypothetical protein
MYSGTIAKGEFLLSFALTGQVQTHILLRVGMLA